MNLAYRGRRAGERLARPRPAAARDVARGDCGARATADPARLPSRGRRRLRRLPPSRGEAAAIGERFGDRDLFAIALHAQGHMLVRAGRVREGLALLDEAMVAVTTQRASPVRRRHRLLRRHPRLPGGLRGRTCARVDARADRVGRAATRSRRVHRPLPRPPRRDPAAGRLVVRRARGGASRREALRRDQEPRRGRRALPPGRAPAAARRVRRCRGGVPRGEPAGWEPQPGLAQLRLAQGKRDAALAAIRRASAEVTEPLKRAALLPAHVEIALAAGEIEEARDGMPRAPRARGAV